MVITNLKLSFLAQQVSSTFSSEEKRSGRIRRDKDGNANEINEMKFNSILEIQ